MSRGGVYIDFKPNEWCAVEDRATFRDWAEGTISTREACKRIARTNALETVTENDFLLEAAWLGYSRDD